MQREEGPKVLGASRPEEDPKVVARFRQGSAAPVRPVDLLAEGDEVPAQGDRWKDWFGRAIGPCGARTRSGWTCRKPGAGTGGRCLLHGGASTGPRTAAGKARSAANSNWRRAVEADPQAGAKAPAEAVAAPAVLTGAGQAPAPAAGPSKPRPSFLDQVLDRALAGAARLPDLDRLLAVVDGGKPLTRFDAIAAAGLPASGRLIELLLARGVLQEQRLGLRVVLLRGLG